MKKEINISFPCFLFDKSEYQYLTEYSAYNGQVKGVLIDSICNCHGNQTKIFAYYGFPKYSSKICKVPGVVLVHGGGGTAFAEWVKIWVDHGYAAIAVDTEGNMPFVNQFSEGAQLMKSDMGGPSNKSYEDSNEKIENQFMYHAISACIVANTFLRNLDMVLQGSIGITGVSWGGIISTLAICYDHRFAFSIPIYGCLNLSSSTGYFRNLYDKNPLAKIWDSNKRLRKDITPTLCINGSNDNFFPLDATMKTATYINAQVSIIYNLQHGHKFAWERKESYFYANSIIGFNPKLIMVKHSPDFRNKKMVLYIPKDNDVLEAKLFQTKDYLLRPQTVWSVEKIDINNKINLQANTNFYYVEILDKYYNIISSKLAIKKY